MRSRYKDTPKRVIVPCANARHSNSSLIPHQITSPTPANQQSNNHRPPTANRQPGPGPTGAPGDGDGRVHVQAAHGATRERHAGGRRPRRTPGGEGVIRRLKPRERGCGACGGIHGGSIGAAVFRGAGTTGAAPAREPATGCAACTPRRPPPPLSLSACATRGTQSSDARQRTTPTAPSRHRRTARSARPRPPRSASPRAIASSHRHGLRARFPRARSTVPLRRA